MRRISNAPDYHLKLEFADGVVGIVGLSEAGPQRMFALWRDPLVFSRFI
jgi:hypothetical protein